MNGGGWKMEQNATPLTRKFWNLAVGLFFSVGFICDTETELLVILGVVKRS